MRRHQAQEHVRSRQTPIDSHRRAEILRMVGGMSVAELHADLAAGCESLGNLGGAWRAAGFVPDADLTAVDRTVVGLQRLLIDLRLARGDQHAA
jgi:hypothetical protein